MNLIKDNYRKIIAGCFAFIMIFQSISGTLEVYAKELGKIDNISSYGEYYNKSLFNNDLLNQETEISDNNEVIKKEPESENETSIYPDEWEVVKKRTVNTKTYKLPNGTYVQEQYFEPIYKEEEGKLVEIDNDLEKVSKNEYTNSDGAYEFKVEDKVVEIVNSNNQKLLITNNEANLSTSSVKDNAILYSEAYKNIDMEYRLTGDNVRINYLINGPTNQKIFKLNFKYDGLKYIDHEEYLDFVDSNNQSVFKYIKPRMYDNSGKQVEIALGYTKSGTNELEIQIEIDSNWVNSNERSYPVKLLMATSDTSKEILGITSSYNRQLQPTVTSTYEQLYVGYENQYWSSSSGTPNMGQTRTYIHVAEIRSTIGENQKIVNAKLKLYKAVTIMESERDEKQQSNTIIVSKSEGYANPANINWNNKPAVTPISTNTITYDKGYQDFDVTSYMEDIYNGKNNTIELKAADESTSLYANVFWSEGSEEGRPKIEVSYRDAWDVDPGMDINAFDTEMRIFAIRDQGFDSLSFDGIAKPDHQVVFELTKKQTGEYVNTQTSKGNADKYFIDPIFITNPISNTQTYVVPNPNVVNSSRPNYTTAYISANQIPEYDVVYEYKIKVTNGSQTSTIDNERSKSDALVKYKVKLGDNLQTIATYYGVLISDIKADNNLSSNVIKEGDVLLVRFKKNNPKLPPEDYQPPIKTIEYTAEYVDRGPRCYGSCDILDPVNSVTGNYFIESIDFSVEDYETIEFNRYYNSMNPRISNMFGNGFTTTLESYISYDKNGNMLYFKGDGKIYKLDKQADGSYQPRIQDAIDLKIVNNEFEIEDIREGKKYQFNSYGYLSKIINSKGQVIEVIYDDYGYVSKMKLGLKEIRFVYNTNNLVKEVILPNGSKVSYEYDSNRNLVKFIDSSTQVTKYNYDSNNYLTSLVNKNGDESTINIYDDEGRVLKQTDGNGNISTISYNNQETIITRSDGSTQTYQSNNNYKIIGIKQGDTTTSKYEYDEYGNIISKEDGEGKITRYSYQRNNLTKINNPDGTSEEYEYNSNNQVIKHTDSIGNITEYGYNGYDLISSKDNSNNNISYVYDNDHRLISETNQYGVSKSYSYSGNQVSKISHSNGLEEFYEYDLNGNVIREGDNQGKNKTYVYNNQNEMIQKNYEDGSNEKWNYDGNGNIVNYQDRLGGVSNNEYDKNNNLVKTSKGNVSRSSKYDSLNRVISETNEQGLTTKYEYDELGHKISEEDHYGNITRYQYDVNGNVIETKDIYGNIETNTYENNNLISSTDRLGNITMYEYDDKNREIKKINPNGTIETKEYEGLLLKRTTDVYGNITTYDYDQYNREIGTNTTYTDGVESKTGQEYDIYENIVKRNNNGLITITSYNVYNQEISSSNGIYETSRKEYDVEGRVVKEIDGLGNYTKTTYNGNGDVISTTDKNGNTKTKEYDVNGYLINEVDELGFVISYKYNNLGQTIEVVDPYSIKTEYIYDDYNNVIETTINGVTIERKEYDEYGRVILETNTTSETSKSYDEYNREETSKNELTGLEVTKTYDKYSNVVKEEDSEGKITKTEYDKYNRVIKVTDGYKRTKETKYDVRDKVVEEKDFTNIIVVNSYDIQGNVIESSSKGLTTVNSYNSINQLVKTTVGNRVSEFVYDNNNQVIESKVEAAITKTEYDKNGNVIKVTDPMGNITINSYDGKNQVVKVTDPMGNITTTLYDAFGKVIKVTNPLGYSTTTKYNEYGQKELEVDERGFGIEYIYNDELLLVETIDKLGNSSYQEYDDSKQVIKTINQNGAVTKYRYDKYQQVIELIEPNGKITTTTYDVLGNVVKEVSGDKETIKTYDKVGNIESSKINGVVQVKNTYNKLNQVVSTIDGNNNESSYKYDIYGNVIYSNEKGYVIEKSYDNYNNVIKQIDNSTYIQEYSYNLNNYLVESKLNNQTILINSYDSNSNVIKEVNRGIEKEMVYDELNRVKEIKIPSISNPNELIVVQKLSYDESGNVVKVEDGLGAVETKKYDGNSKVIEEVNKKGVISKYQYDSLGNLTKSQDVKERYVEYSYDKMNNLELKKINNKIAKYSYDKDSNLIKEENEYGYVNSYSYDVYGNKVSYTSSDGNTIEYQYDNVGNKIREGNIEYTYDQRNNLLTTKNEEGIVVNSYNEFNQMIESIDVLGKKIKYGYNDNNELIRKEYAGIEVGYSYNTQGLLSSVRTNNEETSTYTYNNRGEVITINQGSVVTTKGYDEIGRTIKQETRKDNQIIYEVSNTYDSNDNLIKEVINGKENSYEYNEYEELVKSSKYIEDELVITSYQYDVFGNQRETVNNKGSKIYKYNEKNQVEAVETNKGTIKFKYDENGNLKEKVNEEGRVDSYSYNEKNQLVKLIQGEYEYTYEYDGNNERISESKQDLRDYRYEVWYNYSVKLNVVSKEEIEDTFVGLRSQVSKLEKNGNVCSSKISKKKEVTYKKEAEVREYLVDRNEVYSKVLQENETTYVYGQTLLQENEEIVVSGLNESVVASIKGSEIKRYSYSDYGNTTKINSGKGYNGETKDQSGLIYLRARYYDPEIGRFISIDNNYAGEKEQVNTQNRYIYTLNNPYKYVDRDGNKPMCPGPFSSIIGPVIKLNGKIIPVSLLTKAQVSQYFGGINIGYYAKQELSDLTREWGKTQKGYVSQLWTEAKAQLKQQGATQGQGGAVNPPPKPKDPPKPDTGDGKNGTGKDDNKNQGSGKPSTNVECPNPKFDGINPSKQIDCKLNGNTYTHSRWLNVLTFNEYNPSIVYDLYYYVFITATYNENTGKVNKGVKVAVFIYANDGRADGIAKVTGYKLTVSDFDVAITNVTFKFIISGDGDVGVSGFDKPNLGGSIPIPCLPVTCPNIFKFTPCDNYPQAPQNISGMMLSKKFLG